MCLRNKLFNNQTIPRINNLRSPRFVTFVCESISSEQMIFLCLFEKQAASHDKCIHHPNNQAASGHSSGQHHFQPTRAVWQSSTYRAQGAPGARVQILTTQSHIPEPAIHNHSLLRVHKKNSFKKNHIFQVWCRQIWIKYLQIYETLAKSGIWENYTHRHSLTHRHTQASFQKFYFHKAQYSVIY